MFIDRIIEHFEDAMMQAAFIGVADVHPRALSDRLQTLELIDLGGVIFLAFADAGGARGWWIGNFGLFVRLGHGKAGRPRGGWTPG